MTTIALSCLVLIVAQSAATSRSFAMKHGDPWTSTVTSWAWAGANLAAAFTGTFVVNGSPTKTQILDGQKGKTQVANLTMSLIVLLVVLFFTTTLTDMPQATLGAIVFLIGIDLIDIGGLKRIRRRRLDEFVIAAVTAVVVCVVGVEQGIILAIVVSLLELIRRQYKPRDFLVTLDAQGEPAYQKATPGAQSAPGLLIFRYNAELFYANVNRFVDDVESLIDKAPDPVRWLVVDASAISDIDFSAGISLGGLLDFTTARNITFSLARADDSLLETIEAYRLDDRLDASHVYGNLTDAVAAFNADQPTGPSS